MKKLFFIICLLATGMVAQAQVNTTQTINSKLKLTNVPAGTANDTLLVRGADKVVKKLPKEDLFAAIPTPTLDQVTAAGSSTGNAITLGFVSASQLRLNGIFGSYGELSYSNPNGWLFTGNSEPMLGANYGQITSYVPGNGYGTLDFQNLTAERYFNLPDASGTIALKEYTVGDFINDNATTMAPSMNAVYDALALKANDANVVHKTGNETISGNKWFMGNTITVSNSSIVMNDTGAGYDGGYMLLQQPLEGPNKYIMRSSSLSTNNDQFGEAELIVDAEEGCHLSTHSVDNMNVTRIRSYPTDIMISANDFYTGQQSSIQILPDYLSLTGSGGGVHLLTNGVGGSNVNFINASGSLPVIRNTAPTSSTAPGVKGEIYVDANYIYYCYDNNLWRRVAGSTW